MLNPAPPVNFKIISKFILFFLLKFINVMTDNITKMLLRRRFCKRVILIGLVFGISFYGTVLLFGDLKTPRVMYLTDLDRCPACYGISVCPELYSNQIILVSHSWASIFNAKNIYHAYTKSDRKVILKKLAHNWELKEFDSKLCSNWHLKKNCKPDNLLNMSNVDEKIIDLVKFNLSKTVLEPRKGIIMCPYSYSYYDLIKPVLNNGYGNVDAELINIWTMLSINPEPIILQVLPKSKGWPVPAYGGVCGRLEVVAYEGEPLSKLTHVAWHKKLLYAKKILNGALDFTFKHERFRFYLLDWSVDNIVANEKDDITFVDLEDFVLVDKHISPKKDLPKWYQRYTREDTGPGFSFSIDQMCRHHLSDHNIWAACYVLAGKESAFLYPIPKSVNTTVPNLDKLLKNCLHGDNRFETVSKLHKIIDGILGSKKFVYGVR